MKITMIAIRQKVFMTTKLGSRKRTTVPAIRITCSASRLMISCLLSSFQWRITAMAAKMA